MTSTILSSLLSSCISIRSSAAFTVLLLLCLTAYTSAFSPLVRASFSSFSLSDGTTATPAKDLARKGYTAKLALPKGMLRSCEEDRNVDDLCEDSTLAKGSISIHTRRQVLTQVPTAAIATVALSLVAANAEPALAAGDDITSVSEKVLVLGGTGFVGSQVVAKLKEMGVATVATSRDGRDGTEALDVLVDDIQKRVNQLSSGCTAVISCIGSIGTDQDGAVNAATGQAASAAAKSASVKRFVYITVAPGVKDFAADIDFLKPYLEGKALSRAAVLSNFGASGGAAATLIEPTFIYGGTEFKLNPPRVASFYGKVVEGLLSTSALRAVEGVMPAGFVKVALEPPIPVEDVAAAAVAGALGKAPTPILDSYDRIKEAAAQL